MALIGRGAIVWVVIALPVALVAGCWGNHSMQTHAFYQKHPLLKEMDQAVAGSDPKSNPLTIRKAIILKRIPLGTSRSNAIRASTVSEGTIQRGGTRTIAFCSSSQRLLDDGAAAH
jgi:hypothetical protein